MGEHERADSGDYHAGMVDAKLDAIQQSLTDLREELKTDRAGIDARLHAHGNKIQAIELRMASASGFWSGSKWVAAGVLLGVWELIKLAASHILHGGSRT